MTTDTPYDVIIVGSGAGGGQAAYTLCMAGAKVLMIEAGRHFESATTTMFQINGQAPLRGAPTPDKQLGFYDGTAGGGWTIPGEPYVNDSAEPERQFMWWRSRMLGGRTNHWGRIALRFGPYDFKPRSRDGLGADWPISYEELAPYYDKVEMLIGVFGLFYIPGDHLYADDNEGSADGSHPSDLGFMRQAAVFEPVLRRALGQE